jgi:beta-glucosidase
MEHELNGRDVKPRVITMVEKMGVPMAAVTMYDIDDIDGQFCMLDRSLSGCALVAFSKRMDENIYGKVTVNEKELKKGKIYTLEDMGIQVLFFPVRGVMTEYDKTYTATIEGFVDMEGNRMEPQDITVTTQPKKQPVPGYEEHDGIALEAAREGIVLLKNEGNVLPLKKDETLNVFGKGLFEFRNGATGAGKINPRYHVGMLEAIENYSDFTLNPKLKALYMTDTDVLPSEEVLKDASNQSDIAIITVSRGSGENIDNSAIKGEYYLTDEEEAMIQAVVGKFDKTIAIVNSGYPMDVSWVEKYKIKALISCGFVGMLGGQALIEILDGRVNPSAKLPDTWSIDYYDIPASKNFYNAIDGKPILSADSSCFVDTYYEEDIYVGYRYFETFGKEVAYPFGHGLSYTSFDIKTISFEHTEEHTKLMVNVGNTGNVAGKEVVQIYVEEPDDLLEKPARKLVGFAKTSTLDPGGKQVLTFEINADQLVSYHTQTASWILDKGTYTFYVGSSIQQLEKTGSFVIGETLTIRTVTNRMSPPVPIRILSKFDSEGTYPTGECSGIKPGVTELTPKAIRTRIKDSGIQADVPASLIKYSDVVANPDLLDSFINQLTVEELARLSVCKAAGWGMTGVGEAGRVYTLDKYGMEEFIVADGNSGVNVKKPNIGMPSSATVCASFNTELAYNIGKVIAEEAIENDIHMILGPGMNIHRNPLNGRHPEYFSEDPYLAGIMAGNQSKGLEENGVSSCLKHTVANNCESARKRNHSIMTERALREIYLKAFEVAIQVHKPDSIMTGYNACNGVFTAEDEEMIQGVFREEFGFEGYVMTDWNSYDTADFIEAVAAGNCWLTPGSPDNTFVTPIIEGVRDGKIEKTRLEKNIKHLLNVIIKRARKRTVDIVQ